VKETRTKFQEFIEDAGRHRVFEQESLAFEATELISTLMKEQQVKKADLAKKIGRSKAYVTQLLSGSRNMTLHTFSDLAFALGHKVKLQSSALARSKRETHVYPFSPTAGCGWVAASLPPSHSDAGQISDDFCIDFAPAA
jgi:antitoxin component HigA of HigAB toxin-antitoxin module